MLKSQSHEFFFRADEEGHASKLLNANRGTSDEKIFRELCRLIFDFHAIDLPFLKKPEWPKSNEYGKQRLPRGLTRCIAHQFFNKRYVDIDLTRGLARDGDPVLLDVFASEIVGNAQSGDPCNVSFLIGEAGAGKSALVSYLLAKRGPGWIKDESVVPLRVDLDRKFDHSVPPQGREHSSFLFYVHDQILKAYLALGLLTPDEHAKVYSQTKMDRGDTTAECERRFILLCSQLSRFSGKRPLLIIDNLDFLYHVYDRGLFAKEAAGDRPTKEQESLSTERDRVHKLIQYVIRIWSDTWALETLGISVLIVLREDSLRHYREGANYVPAPDPRDSTYRLKGASLFAVTEAHMKLLKDTISRIPVEGKQRLLSQAADHIDKRSRRPVVNRLHADLFELAKQGLREIMQHYGEFVWLPVAFDESTDLISMTDRFSDQYSASLIAFVQSGNRLYSQFKSEFPNVYLIRGDCDEQRGPAWENLCGPHKHTYWLKRLILQFIAEKQARGEEVKPQGIYDVFSPAGSEKAFEEDIVRLTLGSLAQVENCHVVDFRFTAGGERASYVVDRIALSSRGKRLVGLGTDGKLIPEKAFIDQFIYLQLVVDDYLLPIPKCISQAFAYRGIDYSYLVGNTMDYRSLHEEKLRSVIPQVFYLLDILDESLTFEREVFQDAFAQLEAAGISIPKIAEIEARVVGEIKLIERHSSTEISNFIPTDEDRKSCRDLVSVNLKRAYG